MQTDVTPTPQDFAQDWIQGDWDDAWIEKLASLLGKPKSQVTADDMEHYIPDGKGGIQWVD